MAYRPKQFASVEHLSTEAVAGYVDNELSPIAMKRARLHLVHCAECRREVVAQRKASERLRTAAHDEIPVPSTLLAKLNSIAVSCPDGPGVEATLPKPETFVEKIEVFYRAVKHSQGR